MSNPSAGEILKLAQSYTSSIIDDVLPITVAIANPEKLRIGITIQRDYPLTKIERRYGVPFGHLINNPTRFIWDPDELHGCKWGIEVHEAVFQNDALNDEFIRTGRRQGQVAIVLSTGIGNVLQNLRTVAYIGGTLYYVIGEQFDEPPPYSCLVEYVSEPDQAYRIGVELLLFSESSCFRVDKEKYLVDHTDATTGQDYRSKVRWAVSGYPLIIGGQQVSCETTAYAVSDYRHMWQLPRLKNSLMNQLASLSKRGEKVEFYFGFEQIQHNDYLVPAALGQQIMMPLAVMFDERTLEIMCKVCQIDVSAIRTSAFFDKGRLILDPGEVRKDFTENGYKEKPSRNDVTQPGHFFVDNINKEIVTILLQGIYPHHIVGIASNGHVVNISIGGLSGRSGITIEDAKRLCMAAEMKDAIIFDNGNDVIVRLAGGAVISHMKNQRQRRVTAALHFGCPLPPAAFGGPFEGFELAYTTCPIKPVSSGSYHLSVSHDLADESR